MKVSTQTNTWHEARHQADLAGVVAEIAAAGFDGLEIGAHRVDLNAPEAFRALLAPHNLVVSGIHTHGVLHDPEWWPAARADLERAIAFAAAVGAPFLPISGRPKAEGRKTESDYDRQAVALNALGQRCREQGVMLVYHNHNWEIADECAELQAICARTQPGQVSLILDVGWVVRGGADLATMLDRFLPRVAAFHVKDTTADGRWIEVGDGVVDFDVLFARLDPAADWWLVVERDEALDDARASSQRARDYLRRYEG